MNRPNQAKYRELRDRCRDWGVEIRDIDFSDEQLWKLEDEKFNEIRDKMFMKLCGIKYTDDMSEQERNCYIANKHWIPNEDDLGVVAYRVARDFDILGTLKPYHQAMHVLQYRMGYDDTQTIKEIIESKYGTIENALDVHGFDLNKYYKKIPSQKYLDIWKIAGLLDMGIVPQLVDERGDYGIQPNVSIINAYILLPSDVVDKTIATYKENCFRQGGVPLNQFLRAMIDEYKYTGAISMVIDENYTLHERVNLLERYIDTGIDYRLVQYGVTNENQTEYRKLSNQWRQQGLTHENVLGV